GGPRVALARARGRGSAGPVAPPPAPHEGPAPPAARPGGVPVRLWGPVNVAGPREPPVPRGLFRAAADGRLRARRIGFGHVRRQFKLAGPRLGPDELLAGGG